MNTAIMYDSISRKWPAGAKYILAYIDNPLDEGNYAAAAATGAKVVTISIKGVSGSHAFKIMSDDIEPGCIWPNSTAAQILAGEVRSGLRPTAYTFLDNVSPLQAAVWALGVSPSQIDWFQAHYDNIAAIPPGFVAKQYATNSEYDTSVVNQAWIDGLVQVQPPIPAPPIPDTTKGMLQMFLVRNPGATIKLDNGAEILEGTICACDGAGAVNLGNDWPTIQAAYPNEPVMESASLLARYAKISLH